MFLLNAEVVTADEFNPVGDGVFGGVGKLDVLGDKVAENGGEFDRGFRHVVGQ